MVCLWTSGNALMFRYRGQFWNLCSVPRFVLLDPRSFIDDIPTVILDKIALRILNSLY